MKTIRLEPQEIEALSTIAKLMRSHASKDFYVITGRRYIDGLLVNAFATFEGGKMGMFSFLVSGRKAQLIDHETDEPVKDETRIVMRAMSERYTGYVDAGIKCYVEKCLCHSYQTTDIALGNGWTIRSVKNDVDNVFLCPKHAVTHKVQEVGGSWWLEKKPKIRAYILTDANGNELMRTLKRGVAEAGERTSQGTIMTHVDFYEGETVALAYMQDNIPKKLAGQHAIIKVVRNQTVDLFVPSERGSRNSVNASALRKVVD